MLCQNGKTPVILGTGGRHEAIDHLLLEHQHHVGDVARRVQPLHQQGGRHVVGQVGHDPAGRRAEIPRLDPEGIGLHEFEASVGHGLQFEERAECPRVHFDGDDPVCPFEQQRAREATRPRADFDHGPVVQRRCRARDAARQVEVEQEMLAEALPGIEPVGGDGLAEGGQGLDAVHLSGRAGAPCRPPCRWPPAGWPGRHGRCPQCRVPCHGRARFARRAGRASR